MTLDRRQILWSAALAAGVGALPASIARALDIPAHTKTGTIKDVEHVVIFTQENRAFDHYFGTLNGVKGFGDRFPIPVPDIEARKGRTVWVQPNEHAGEHRDNLALIAPFALNTQQTFAHMRHEGTPHNFTDAQAAWDNGRLSNWPKAKHNHAMGYFTRADIPFQFALAEAFTLCDAYHCALHAGTNPNRTFIWTATNNADGTQNGPVIYNDYDHLSADPKHHGGYGWVTYSERLQAAGITWQIYQDAADNFTDNPLEGFKLYRAADKAKDGRLLEIANRALRTRTLDQLKDDVVGNRLPQVSWIVATAEGSEHPGPSSPAQGADYTARVLDALTANPAVWSKTVLLLNFDENDGLFDHVPPPSPPAQDSHGQPTGASQIDTTGEYHVLSQGDADAKYLNRAYGLGPRVPMYVISPWSKGGFVSSEVFDHTSVIRFLEARFGVAEPNISPWRRAVCGDLTACFDFANPNAEAFFSHLPATKALADQARALGHRTTPPTPQTITPPVQEAGLRPRRATPYVLEVGAEAAGDQVRLTFANQGTGRAVVFHVYDRLNLEAVPRRYTVAAGKSLSDTWPAVHDLWVMGPNGFHRHFKGAKALVTAKVTTDLVLHNSGPAAIQVTVKDEAYGASAQTVTLAAQTDHVMMLDLKASHNWYDLSLTGDGFYQRLAGHIENGQPSLSDPAAHGPAVLDQA